MLKFEPSKRIQVKDALQHPFFQSQYDNINHTDENREDDKELQ